MEPIRIARISGLAIVTYFLFLQWQEDYGQPVVSQEATIATANFGGGDAPISASELSDKSNNINSLIEDSVSSVDAELEEDLPSLSPSSDLPQVSAIEPSADLISVDTDIFSIKIDPKGGDLVYLALKNYPVAVDQPDRPFVVLNNTPSFTYVAQSGVIGPKGTDLDSKSRPLYRSDKQAYSLTDEALEVPLYYDVGNGVSVVKRFTFSRNNYAIDVTYDISNSGSSAWQGVFFSQIKRDGSSDPGLSSSGFGLPTYLGPAYWKPDERYNKLDFDDILDAHTEGRKALNENIAGGWIAMVQHYFLTAWIPNKDQSHRYTSRVNSKGEYIVGLTSEPVLVPAGSEASISASYYAGPKIKENLVSLSDGIELTIDFGFLFFLSDALFFIMKFIYENIVANWGWSIILLTLFIKALLYPLSAASFRSMANMRRLQPEMARLKERHGDDRQAMSQAMMKMYKEEKINPLGSCLPMLLQMPVFLALYYALLESVELRHAPWIAWINDLSVMDPFFVLPLLMGASMWFQQKLSPQMADPMQAKMMQFMPIIFTIFFLFFPAGLVLYWLTNNVVSITQQWYVTKKIESEAAKKK